MAAAEQAAPAAAGAPARLNAVEQKARDAVLARFRALSIQDGIVLVPLSKVTGVESVEVRGGAVALNGRPATGAEVRDRLGRDADAVLQLSYFDLGTQKRLLLPGATSEPAAGAAPPSPAPSSAAPPLPPAVPEAPEAAAPSSPEAEVRREYDARVRIFGDVTVERDEQVNGAVVAIGGSVKVNGRVRDNVVAVGGNVKLGPHAEVLGDVTAVGGTIERDAGAVVSGRLNEVAMNAPGVRIRPDWNVHWWPWFGGRAWSAVRVLGTLLRMAVFALLAALILLVAPRAVRRVEHAVTTEPWKAAATGVLAQLFFIPVLILVVVVLAISIVGIPLLALVPFGVLAFCAALMLGFTGAVSGLARLVWRRGEASGATSFGYLGVGLAVVWSVTLLGRVVGIAGGLATSIAIALVVIGVLIEFAVWTLGLGGALLTRFGTRGAVATPAPPAPPSEPLTGEVV
jgi:hypothetical protein